MQILGKRCQRCPLIPLQALDGLPLMNHGQGFRDTKGLNVKINKFV